jgi:hypothetical protein
MIKKIVEPLNDFFKSIINLKLSDAQFHFACIKTFFSALKSSKGGQHAPK